MKLLSGPRQPFVGLALTAGLGIIVSDFLPISQFALGVVAITLVICALVALWPTLIAGYVIVGVCFFLLHGFRTTDTAGRRLAAQLGDRPRAVSVTGSVANEPKIASSGLATFLLKLESVDFEGKNAAEQCHLVCSLARRAEIRR